MSSQLKAISPYEFHLIQLVNKRVQDIARSQNVRILQWQLLLDLEFCHLCQPLALHLMLDGPAGDLIHDINGIRDNLNRRTKLIENGFVSRFALENHV